MTVRELYHFLEERIPSALSCAWDHDGLMCCADDRAEVRKALIALDVTEAAVARALELHCDLIVSHHPLIFHPLQAVTEDDAVAKKVIRLLGAGISVMSFHTRLDAVAGGVNDVLAARLGLQHAVPFGQNGESIGRIGSLKEPMSLISFAQTVKQVTGAETVQISDAGRPVLQVAVLGGGGSDDVEAARAAGADTYLTGELKHHQLTEAPERGMNLIMGGHFYTEDPVCRRLQALLAEADASVETVLFNSNPVRFV